MTLISITQMISWNIIFYIISYFFLNCFTNSQKNSGSLFFANFCFLSLYVFCSYPIDLIVQEMVGNGQFLRSILERNVDTNHDGQVTLKELFSVPSPLNNETI